MGGNGFKIGLMVVALALAGGIWVWSSQPEPIPEKKDADLTDILCEACGEHSQVPVQELAKVEISGQVKPVGEGGGVTRRQARERSLFPCPKCNEPMAVLASFCQEHNKYFARELSDGTRGQCPDCP